MWFGSPRWDRAVLPSSPDSMSRRTTHTLPTPPPLAFHTEQKTLPTKKLCSAPACERPSLPFLVCARQIEPRSGVPADLQTFLMGPLFERNGSIDRHLQIVRGDTALSTCKTHRVAPAGNRAGFARPSWGKPVAMRKADIYPPVKRYGPACRSPLATSSSTCDFAPLPQSESPSESSA